MKFLSLSKTHLAGLIVCLCASNIALADSTKTMPWTTLGTQGNPNIRVDRSQPQQVERVFISHQHFDHIGDLSPLIGLRLDARRSQTINSVWSKSSYARTGIHPYQHTAQNRCHRIRAKNSVRIRI